MTLVPWALDDDGRSYFATVYSKRGFSGVVRVAAASSKVTEIKAFAGAGSSEAGGSFDGRWLVWTEWKGLQSFDDFAVWAWDSDTGRVWEIGAATRSPNGSFWQSGWDAPAVKDGIAAWSQGSGPNGLTAVHVYNLRTHSGRIIHTGHAQGPFLLDSGLVAWPESPSPGDYTRMYVAAARTGKLVRTPLALERLRGISGLETDGQAIAYPSANFNALWWSPSLERKPQLVMTARPSHHIDNSVHVTGRYLAFGSQPALFVGDTHLRRYLKIGDSYGSIWLSRRTLVVAWPASNVKSIYARQAVFFVPVADLPPMPTCARVAASKGLRR